MTAQEALRARFELDRADVPGSIVRAATAWLGVRYAHAADVFGEGIDCAMLPVRVFVDLGLVEHFDPRPYPHDWMLHRGEERYLGWVEKYADKMPDALPGDIALFRVGRCLAHGGIVETPDIMIHADMHAGKVERCEIARFADRLAGFWRLKT